MFEGEDNMTPTDFRMESDGDDLLTEQNEQNLQFIQAMVQLKSIVNTCSYVPAPELQNILLAAHTGNSKETEECQTDASLGLLFSDRSRSQQLAVIPDFSHSEIGFGFGTNSSTSVSSGILKYIIHSSDANHLLVRSVEAVLQYLGQSILTEKSESLDLIVQNWKGSVLEYSLNILVELVDRFAYQGDGQNECREICFTFFCSFVDGILSSDSLNMVNLNLNFRIRAVVVSDIISLFKLKRMRQAQNAAHIRGIRNAYSILETKSEGKRHLRDICMATWEHNIKMDLTERVYEYVDSSIYGVQDRD
jgi:hypothetical protein